MLSNKPRGLSVPLFALVFTFVALPSFAAGPAAPATPEVAAAAAICAAAPAASAAATPELGVPVWLELDGASITPGGASTSGKFRGFCPCGCSFIRDCNTSADCYGGATCRAAPSCC